MAVGFEINARLELDDLNAILAKTRPDPRRAGAEGRGRGGSALLRAQGAV